MKAFRNNRRRALSLAAVLVVSFWATSGNAGSLDPSSAPGPTMKTLSEVEARTPIKASDLPLVINESGSYYLTETIEFSQTDTNGITVTADDVTIDLNGYALVGQFWNGTTGDGIHGSGSRLSVMNGSVRKWRNNGISLGNQSRVTNVKAHSNVNRGIEVGFHSLVEDCIAQANEGAGIYLAGKCTVKNCIANGNYSTTSSGYGIRAGANSVVTGCVANDNADDGINANTGCVIARCSSCNNTQAGIDADGSAVIGNVCLSNGTNYDLSDCTQADNH